VVCRSREFLKNWRELAVTLPFHTCFDQNIFNLLIQRRNKFTRLPGRLRTLRGAFLAEVTIVIDDSGRETLRVGTEMPLLVHATLQGQQYHVQAPGPMSFGSDQIHCPLRMFRGPRLRGMQRKPFSEFFSEAKEELRTARVLAAN
jgi:hypothetical protein